MIVILMLICLLLSFMFSWIGSAVDEIFRVINNVAGNNLRVTNNLRACYSNCLIG